MPHVYDEDRWDEVTPGVHVRRVGGEVKGPAATESALEMAAAYGVDLSEVTGTGANGRITKADVEKYLEEDDE